MSNRLNANFHSKDFPRIQSYPLPRLNKCVECGTATNEKYRTNVRYLRRFGGSQELIEHISTCPNSKCARFNHNIYPERLTPPNSAYHWEVILEVGRLRRQEQKTFNEITQILKDRGVPIMEDRARQAITLFALEPMWEAKFEPNSYGFRPGRSTWDATEAIFSAIKQKNKYALDADIQKCFDRIDHQVLLQKLKTGKRIRQAIKAWLQAGILDGKDLFPMKRGTPQGGVISPLLANIALHGIEAVLQKSFPKSQCPRLIRYADDFVVLHPNLEVIIRAKHILEEWLAPLGLELNQE